MSELAIATQLDSADVARMFTTARASASMAYAPYSNFHVGAALLDDRGGIIGGCNVENASYGLTNCAERVAIGAAVAQGAGPIRAVAIYTPTETYTYPCGACRQVLHEFNPAMEIHLFKKDGQHFITRLDLIFASGFDFKPTA